MRRHIALTGAAFGNHCLALGRRYGFGNRIELLGFFRRLSVIAKFQRGNQCAMHCQIGITANGRGEMRIAAQIEPEMADIIDGVNGLRLRTQYDFRHAGRVRAFQCLRHQPVEHMRQ